MENTPLKVVAIGGGTGLSSLLAGLKVYAGPKGQGRPQVDITAMVTVTDDGGSSGRLRREFDVLPPGDIRNCMVALSEDSALLARLFQHRFSSGRGLKGHSFGNLFLAALTQVTGDFPEAVKASSQVLKTAGRIYPATAEHVELEATMADGTKVRGETKITAAGKRIERVRLIPDTARPLSETVTAIAEADVITLGPGSLFTSVVPNLLVQGIVPAIRKSKALKAYFVNLMSQPGETTEFRASDHVRALVDHAGRNILDYAVLHLGKLPPAVLKRYAGQGAFQVENDLEAIYELGVKVSLGKLATGSGKLRHDPVATAKMVVALAKMGRVRKTRQT